MGSFLSTPGGEDDAVGVQHAEPLDTAASLAAADARFAAALQRPLPPQRAFQRRRTTSALPVRTLPTAWSPRSPLEANFKDDDVLEDTAQPLQDVLEPDPDISEDGPVSIESRVEYSALPKGASQAIFGLVTLRAAAQVASSERRHMDLVCVLDISGSMGDQNKIGDLKSAMRFIIDELQPTDRLSIVTFENFGHRCLRLRRMDSQGRDEATVQTMRLQAGGGTNIAEGLDLGLAVLEQRRQRNQVSAILLLTDGQDSSFRCAIPSMVQRASKAGAGLYAFGFGQDHDADLLRGVSEQAKTPYTFIEDTATVKAFAGVVGGLSSVVAQNLQLKLDCSALLVDVNTPFQVEKSGDTKATVSIPDIFAGERRDVLLELSIPADLAGDDAGKLKLLEASVRYLHLQPPGSGFGSVLVQSPPETMFVQRTEEPQPEQEPDAEVADQRERVEVAKALATAATKSDSGQFDEARSLLKRQREKVSRRTSHITQALTLELEDAEHRMESQLSWQTGHAEVRDALSMHRMQRCTNSLMSSSSQVYKRSKTMYVTSVQEAWSRTASASSTDL